MLNKPDFTPPTIADIEIIECKGPWPTKSNGELNVLFGIKFEDIQKKYFSYNNSELNKIPWDVRGLRSYRVNGLSKGSIGANEWHRIRNELVFATKGKVRWTCEDIYGNTTEHILDSAYGIWIPPFILHTYEALEQDCELLVTANTLFRPDMPITHDTFSVSDFQNLQNSY